MAFWPLSGVVLVATCACGGSATDSSIIRRHRGLDGEVLATLSSSGGTVITHSAMQADAKAGTMITLSAMQGSGFKYYVEPPLATECASGQPVPQSDCQAAAYEILNSTSNSYTALRSLQVGSNAGACSTNVHACSWNCVPKGCSIQSGGDFAPHFNSGVSCNPFDVYQLICQVALGQRDYQEVITNDGLSGDCRTKGPTGFPLASPRPGYFIERSQGGTAALCASSCDAHYKWCQGYAFGEDAGLSMMHECLLYVASNDPITAWDFPDPVGFENKREDQEGCGDRCENPISKVQAATEGDAITYKCYTTAMPVDCKLGNWGKYGKCSARCGITDGHRGGKKTKTRTVKAEENAFGNCHGLLQEHDFCGTRNCTVAKDGKCSYTVDIRRSDDPNHYARMFDSFPKDEFTFDGCTKEGAAAKNCIDTHSVTEGVRTLKNKQGDVMSHGNCCNGVQNTVVNTTVACEEKEDAEDAADVDSDIESHGARGCPSLLVFSTVSLLLCLQQFLVTGTLR